MEVTKALMKNICALCGIFCLATAHALAGDVGKELQPAPPGPFDRGTYELEGGAGEFLSFSTTAARRVTINYQMEDLRLGWMYDSPRRDDWLGGLLCGNSEFLAELFGGPVTKGQEGYLAGGSLLWRYNFVQPGARLVPYIQLGAGGLGNDIFVDHRQREIGEAFEFVLQGDAGLKYLINDQWAVSLEGDFRHMSNADLASRNEGLNSIGALMQVSYFFH
jgi:opacity protein-like surface antigen